MYQYRDNGSSDVWARSPIEQELVDYQQKVYGGRQRFASQAISPKPQNHNGQLPIIRRYIVKP